MVLLIDWKCIVAPTPVHLEQPSLYPIMLLSVITIEILDTTDILEVILMLAVLSSTIDIPIITISTWIILVYTHVTLETAEAIILQ